MDSNPADRKKRKAPDDYSSNPKTKKNNEARARLSGEEFERIKGKNADNKAYSVFWAKFKRDAITILNSAGNTNERAQLEKELHQQALVIAVIHRFNSGRHWTQLAKARCPNEEFPPMGSFITMPATWYEVPGYDKPDIKETNTAPNTMVPDTSVDINEFGVMAYGDKPNDEDYEEDYSEDEFRAAQELKAGARIASIEFSIAAAIQFWDKASVLAAQKFTTLRYYGYEAFVRKLGPKEFTAAVKYIFPAFKSGQYTVPTNLFKPHYRSLKSGLLHVASYNLATRKGILLDNASGLPLLPFSKLFTRPERAVIGLVYKCQIMGLYMQSDIKVAKNGLACQLPGGYKYQTLTSTRLVRKFPTMELGTKDAKYMLSLITKRRQATIDDLDMLCQLLNF